MAYKKMFILVDVDDHNPNFDFENPFERTVLKLTVEGEFKFETEDEAFEAAIESNMYSFTILPYYERI